MTPGPKISNFFKLGSLGYYLSRAALLWDDVIFLESFLKSFYLIIIFLLFSNLSHAYVNKKQVGNLDKCHMAGAFKNFHTLMETECRYLYTKTWGWIDLRHFGAGVMMVQKGATLNESRLKVYYAVLAGEMHEEMGDVTSAYSYEDLVSNFLGASFQHLYSNKYFGDKTFTSSLKTFFKELMISSYPEVEAPYFKDLDDYKELKNFDYYPAFRTETSWQMNRIQLKLNSLRIEVTAFINSSTWIRGEVLDWLKQIPEVNEYLKNIERENHIFDKKND